MREREREGGGEREGGREGDRERERGEGGREGEYAGKIIIRCTCTYTVLT